MKYNSDWLVCIAPSRSTPGTPEITDADFNVCGHEAKHNSVTMPALKKRLVVTFRPQNYIKSHPRASKCTQNPREACPNPLA